MKEPQSSADNTAEKRGNWSFRKKRYFRHSKVKLKTVLRYLGFYCVPWYFAGKPKQKPILITRKNVPDLVAVPKDELVGNTGLFIRLSAVDLYIIYKWIRLNKINFRRFEGMRLFVQEPVLVKSREKLEIRDHHYLCLEQDKENPELWVLKVRSREYLRTKETNSYHALSLQRR